MLSVITSVQPSSFPFTFVPDTELVLASAKRQGKVDK